MPKDAKLGFTLIEIIIVIGLIGLLAVFTIVAIDPARRIGEARNSLRATDAKNIKKALENFATDNTSNNNTLPTAFINLINNTNYMIATAGDTTGGTVSCAAVGNITKVDITNGASTLFNYLATIPIDPEITTPYTSGSGYYFKKNGNRIIDVKPCNVYTYSGSSGESSPLSISGIAFNGSETSFQTYVTNSELSIVKLTDTTFANSYYRTSGTNGQSIVGTVTGSSVAFGSAANHHVGQNWNINALAFANNKIGVGFGDGTNGAYVLGTISGSTITFDTANEAVFNASTSGSDSDLIDSTNFVIAYTDSGNSNYGTARTGAVSGTVASFPGTEYTFTNYNASYISISMLDSTRFVVAWRQNTVGTCGVLGCGNVAIGTISGNTINYGTVANFNSNTSAIEVKALDSSSFVILYSDITNSSYGTAIVGTVTGSTITLGNEYIFNNASTSYLGVDKIDATNVVFTYTSGNIVKANIAQINGTAISYLTTATVYSGSSISSTEIQVLDNYTFVVSFIDQVVMTVTGYGKVGTITWQ